MFWSVYWSLNPGKDVFVCSCLATSREVPCCCTSGEFPSLKGCAYVCEREWETRAEERTRLYARYWLQMFNITPLLMLFDLSPFDKADSEHIPATPDDLFKGWLVLYSLLYHNPSNDAFSTHSITACSFHYSSPLHPGKYGHTFPHTHTHAARSHSPFCLPVPLPWVDRNERIMVERVCRCH